MSIFKSLLSLFGGGAGASAEPEASVEHQGYEIRATPFEEGGQFQTCGVITQQVDGVMKEHRFVRADRFASRDEAASFALDKGRQIIDQHARMAQGRSLFD